MKIFIEALRESIITQAVITVSVVGVWLYLVATGQPIPTDLTQLMTIVIGFYFGSKVGYKQGQYSQEKYILKRETDETDPRIHLPKYKQAILGKKR